MQSCMITITSTIDGQEMQTKRQGKMLLSSGAVTLSYQEDGDDVVLFLENEKGQMQRTGAQSLKVPFNIKEIVQGEIVLGDMHGIMDVKTHKLAFSVNEKSLLVQLHYDLIFGQEKQAMRLRIYAYAINK